LEHTFYRTTLMVITVTKRFGRNLGLGMMLAVAKV